MARQNRVTPFGEIVEASARGTLTGNRGILHDEAGRIRRRWAGKAWIYCLLAYKDHRRAIMAPHQYTHLFFLDEATALAAGHRPCAYCQRARFEEFRSHWAEATGAAQPVRAPDIDRALHAERLDGRRAKRTWPARLGDLPDGAFAVLPGARYRAARVSRGHLVPWDAAGYGAAVASAPDQTVDVLTPRTTTAILDAGFAPRMPGLAV